MRSFISFAALFFAVYADPTPTGPAPGAVFNEGTQCTIQWNPDTSGGSIWKTMNLQLMTGDNYNMIPLSTVGSVDGTDPSHNTFAYPCLKVTPHAPIYFYQFSSPNSPNLYWTGRFTLAGPNGESVPAPNQTQPGSGANIPWGVGRLVDPSQATPPPPIGGGSTSSSGANPGAPSASANSSSIATPAPTSESSSIGPDTATSSDIQTLSLPSSTGSSSGSETPTTTAGAAAVSSGAATGRDHTAFLTAIFSLLFTLLS